MEEVVTRKFIHADSSSVTSLCGKDKVTLLSGLMFKFNSYNSQIKISAYNYYLISYVLQTFPERTRSFPLQLCGNEILIDLCFSF